MAKFCTNCGKQLEAGKACSCKEKKGTKTKTVSGGNVRDDINLYMEVAKDIFRKPVDVVKKHSKGENIIFSLIAIAINSLLFGLLLYCIAKEGSSLLGIGGSFFGYTLEIPFLKTVLQGFMYAVVASIVMIGSIYVLAGMVLKANADFRKIAVLVGICSVATSIGFVLTIIFTFLSMNVALVLLFITMLFHLVYLFQGISETIKLDENKLAYAFVPAVFATVFVLIYVLPKLLS